MKSNSGIPFKIVFPLIGVLVGCLVGFFAAHYFAFYGGFALIGEPFSPARYSLVPGHMLLCSIILGVAGYLIALKAENN